MQRFSLRLQEALERATLTPAELAQRIGVDASTVHRWLKEGQIPQPRTLTAAATCLGVNSGWLAGESDAPPVALLTREGAPDYSSFEGSRAAFLYLIETMKLPRLIEHLSQILSDDSQSAEKRVAMARSLLPTIERRKREMELQMQE